MAEIAIITGATGGLGQEFIKETLKETSTTRASVKETVT